jgi:hypothetical protein
MSGFLHYWWHCIQTGWQFGDGVFGKIEFVFALASGFLLFHRKLRKHRATLEEHAMKATFWITASAFLISTIFVAPFVQEKESSIDLNAQRLLNTEIQKQLADKSPKLEGFINQSLLFDQVGTNSLIFLQAILQNSGGSASGAENYKLQVTLTNNVITNAEPLNFGNEYELTYLREDRLFLIHLNRTNLLEEKTMNALAPGDFRRGWLAFKLDGIQPLASLPRTNFVLSFLDAAARRIAVTNGLWQGKQATNFVYAPMPLTFAGSENILNDITPLPSTTWVPPELPPGCSNVVISLGSISSVLPRWSLEQQGTNGIVWNMRDVPDSFAHNFENLPGYSPRQKKYPVLPVSTLSIGDKTIAMPVQPVVISNRLYVEVQVPFLNEKHRLIMSDAFDPELPIPQNWDRNYSTNYCGIRGTFVYEIVNELKNPVLQVFYSAPNEIHVNGIFQVDSNSILVAFGQLPQLLTFYLSETNATITSLQAETFRETLTIQTNETIASFGRRLTNEFFRPIFKNQRPIFKYPSNRNFGAFAGIGQETNKSDTKP